jgi:hypothetical protein
MSIPASAIRRLMGVAPTAYLNWHCARTGAAPRARRCREILQRTLDQIAMSSRRAGSPRFAGTS